MPFTILQWEAKYFSTKNGLCQQYHCWEATLTHVCCLVSFSDWILWLNCGPWLVNIFILILLPFVAKHLTRSNSRKEGFILAYGARLQSIVAGKAAEEVHGCGCKEAACWHHGGPGMLRGHAIIKYFSPSPLFIPSKIQAPRMGLVYTCLHSGLVYTQVGSLSLLILSAKALTGAQTPKAVLHSCLGCILF